ncbi:MAG: elements of external origin [Alphaproteobacteria bacterium]|nr:elements of external origin [Alphaproteobacteria bacterium]
MGLSLRKYAAHRGISHPAVMKAIKAGRITPEPDGTIDPVKADRQWGARTDPAQQRVRKSTSATKPVPKSAIRAVDETLGDTGGGEVSFLRARMANEVLKAQTAKVRLQKMKGELINRDKAIGTAFDFARRIRDSWMNWPPRVAADMAADLGVEAHAMEQVLERHIRQHLADLAETEIELR